MIAHHAIVYTSRGCNGRDIWRKDMGILEDVLYRSAVCYVCAVCVCCVIYSRVL